MKEDLFRYRQALSCLAQPLRGYLLDNGNVLADKITEIRLRVNRPVCVQCTSERLYITASGRLSPFYSDSLLKADRQMLESAVHTICEYSVYSRQNEISEGFVTLLGGHRAGICGTAVMRGGVISNIRDISSLNLRFAREVRGCADNLLRRISNIKSGVLVCGAPNSGKTTFIRDLARQLSYRYKISLIDERYELAACVGGEPQNDVGLCDVYCGYPKAAAMIQAVRSMSPEIIICDEIGSAEEFDALAECRRCGVSVIATAHAENADSMIFGQLLDTNAFSTAVFLKDREVSAVKSLGERRAA